MPKGWSHNRLDSVCSKITDGAHHSPKSVDIGYPMYSVKDMSYSGFYENTARLIDEVDYLSLVNQNCKPLINDILIAKDGSILKHCFVVKENVEGVILSSIALLRPKLEKIYPEYIAQYFSQEWVKSFVVRALTSGSGVPRIILKDFKSIKIPLPPLPEQQKIAKILSTWDKAISTTECLIDNSTQQKKALMQQLLTGKKRLLDDEGKRFDKKWERIELGKLLDYKQPTPYLVKSTDYSDEYPTPVLTAGKTFILGYTDEEFGIFSEDLPTIIFDDFTTASKFVDFPFKAKSSAMKMLVAKDGVSIKYIFEVMQALSYAIGGHQRHWISIFANIVIGLPCLEEQQKITAVSNNADKEIELLEQQLADLQQEKKALMQVLLTGKKRVRINDRT